MPGDVLSPCSTGPQVSRLYGAPAVIWPEPYAPEPELPREGKTSSLSGFGGGWRALLLLLLLLKGLAGLVSPGL